MLLRYKKPPPNVSFFTPAAARVAFKRTLGYISKRVNLISVHSKAQIRTNWGGWRTEALLHYTRLNATVIILNMRAREFQWGRLIWRRANVWLTEGRALPVSALFSESITSLWDFCIQKGMIFHVTPSPPALKESMTVKNAAWFMWKILGSGR